MRVLEKQKLRFRPHWSKEGEPMEEVQLWVVTYPNGRIGLQLTCMTEFGNEPYMVASVNLPDEPCPPEEMWVKDYSENEGIVEALSRWGVIEDEPTATTLSGWVNISRYRFSASFLMELAAKITAGKKVRR